MSARGLCPALVLLAISACANAGGSATSDGVDANVDVPLDAGESETMVQTKPDAGGRDAGKSASCGDGTRSAGEECDDANRSSGDGCSDSCKLELGYDCKVAGQRCAVKVVCGDGRMGQGEQCDDGNAVGGDGCAADCSVVETYFVCPTVGSACTPTVVCGDAEWAASEQCDDGNTGDGDGCSHDCRLEPGYACPLANAPCRPACGDAYRLGNEECDDGDRETGDGCDAHCRVELGFVCPPNAACRTTTCGDAVVEGSEQCDDGANDRPYDGCYHCRREPTCASQGCAASCGDGNKFPDEACDDGNTRAGDGCSSSCALEPGFDCEHQSVVPPATLALPILYRDLRGTDLPAIPAANLAAGHYDFQRNVGVEQGIVGPLYGLLGTDGKPIYAKPDGTSATTSTAANFAKWYHDDPAYNRAIAAELTFNKQSDGSYLFQSDTFFPLDGRGFVAESVGGGAMAEPLRTDNHNFHFTSELRYVFAYQGGERLDFYGDDDVWVFVNGRLVVDLGGVHLSVAGSITLEDDGADERFGLVRGRMYELAVFQAERCTPFSRYKLTLSGFLRARTHCASVCGDSIVSPDEVCDDGKNDGTGGTCAPGCQAFGPRCGDNSTQPSCPLGPRCGDGKVDRLYGEQCDDGVNDGGYDQCAPGCVFGERCGDQIVQAPEQCDDGNQEGSDGCDNTCHAMIVM